MCRCIRRISTALAVVLAIALLLPAQAKAAQAGGSISLIAASPNLVEGQIFNVQVRITNTSSEDLDPPGNGDPIAATYTAGGAISVILACTDSTCTTELPGTLTFLSCPAVQPGVVCAANGANGVTISVTADVAIPAAGFVNIATMQLQAETPYPGGTPTGTFFQRAATGPDDLAAFSPIEQVTVTGGAEGSRNFLFPPVCEIQVDKQISCDGGQTWADAGPGGAPLFDDGQATPCSTADPNLVQVRYIVHNPSSSLTVSGCTLTESNPDFGTPGAVPELGPDGEATIPGTLTPACVAAEDGEPNTATVTCNLCQGVTQTTPPITDSDQANLICEPADLLVDRNVDCGPAGPNNTGGTSDEQLVRANDDGTLGCRAPDGGEVCWTYVASNPSAVTLYDCTWVDTSSIVGGNGTPVIIGNLAPGAQASVDCDDVPRLGQLCSDALETSEVPNSGNLGLTCCTVDVDGIANCDPDQRVVRFDISTVTCLSPDFEARKECVDLNGDGTDDAVNVFTENTGQQDLNCTVVDNIYLSDPSCPPVGAGTLVPVIPDQFAIAPGNTVMSDGALPTLTADACNQATVTCSDLNGSPLAPISVNDLCNFEPEEEGCLTRTPGFWGTHPEITALYLNVEVCGVTIDNVSAGVTDSAIEAICSVGKDGKILGPQTTQLVRQCTAAALNIAASLALEGDCSNTSGVEFIDETFAACCSDTSVCTGDPVAGFSVEACISALDLFNNFPGDTLNFPFKTGPAKPKTCQDAKNNGVVVTPQ